MTAKQKAAREKFKKVVAEASKLRKKNPKLTQAQAVKQAWAISYSKSKKSEVGQVVKKSTKSKQYKDWTNATDLEVIKNFVPYLEEYTQDGKKYWSSIGLEKRNGKWVETLQYRFNNLKNAKDFIFAEYGKLPQVRKTKKVGLIKKKSAVTKKSTSVKSKKGKSTEMHTDTNSHNVKIKIMSGIEKSIGALQREYVAVYDLPNGSSDYELFKASSLKEAKKYAQFHKRRQNIKGKVSVKLIRK